MIENANHKHKLLSYICRAHRQKGERQDEIITGEEDCHDCLVATSNVYTAKKMKMTASCELRVRGKEKETRGKGTTDRSC